MPPVGVPIKLEVHAQANGLLIVSVSKRSRVNEGSTTAPEAERFCFTIFILVVSSAISEGFKNYCTIYTCRVPTISQPKKH